MAKRGVVIELNCETDFVAKNADFVAFANSIADLAVEQNPANLEALNQLTLNGVTIAEACIEQTGKIGEKIGVSKYEVIDRRKSGCLHPR
jgi:elongation factor Ts